MFDFLSKMTVGQKKVFFVALFLVILALFDRLFLAPILERIDLIKLEMGQQVTNIETDAKILAHKIRIRKESKLLEKYFLDNLPEDSVVNGNILTLVERISSQNNVKLVKSKPSHVDKDNGFYKYYVDIECGGELKDIVSFMHAINATDHLLQIDQYRLTPKRGEDNQIRATFTVARLLVSLEISESEDPQ